MTHTLGARVLAELAGTTALVGIGTGAIVAGTRVGGVPQWELAIAWFLAVAIPIQLFASVSGAHLNPAVTVGLVASRKFPKREVAPFVLAQIGGAFLGSLVVLAVLGGASHLGATLPGSNGPVWIFPLEFTFTFLLILSVLYLAELSRPPSRVELLLPAVVVGVSTLLIGPWTGSSLNPARSVAPAVLSGAYDWLWIYLGATLLAAAIAALGSAFARKAARARPVSSKGGPQL
ncbi:MAG TPA: aquaporin [Thermoplasmata archaeon]|nr:aquaporin [Thermoplasmata archaeon]